MKFKFKENIDTIYTDDPYYDLTSGGYIVPENVLTDKEQIDKLNYAVMLIEEFFDQAEIAGVIEYS